MNSLIRNLSTNLEPGAHLKPVNSTFPSASLCVFWVTRRGMPSKYSNPSSFSAAFTVWDVHGTSPSNSKNVSPTPVHTVAQAPTYLTSFTSNFHRGEVSRTRHVRICIPTSCHPSTKLATYDDDNLDLAGHHTRPCNPTSLNPSHEHHHTFRP